MNHQCRTVLAIDSDALSSRELADILKLQPDERWDKGTTYHIRGKEKLNRFSRWSMVEIVSEIHELCEAMERLRDRIEPIRSNFSSLPAGTTIGLTVMITTTQTVFGLGLNADQLRYWASLGATVDVSVAVSQKV